MGGVLLFIKDPIVSVKLLLSFSLFILLSSCSSVDLKKVFQKKENTKKRNAELMEDFKVEDDVLVKFQEKKETKIVKEMKEIKKVKAEITKTSKKIKKIKPAKSVYKRVPKQKVIPTKLTPVKTEFKYPKENYPEQYIAIDKNSAQFWNSFSPIIIEGEQAIFSVTYGGISTGNITIETRKSTVLGGKAAYHFHSRMKTSSFYSYLYEVDDIADSYVQQSNFLPLKFSLIQRQSAQDIDDLQLFDQEKLEVYTFYKRVRSKKVKKRKEVKPIPRFYQDPISVLYFLRGMPMETGKSYRIPFMNKGVAEILEVEFGEIEELNTDIGLRKAYKVMVSSAHEGKTIKGGAMRFWFSADEDRVFLKFSAKIKIGSIVGRIKEYTRL